MSKVVGVAARPHSETVERIVEHRPGDMEALANSIQPAMRQAHSAIGHGATIINVYGSHNQVTLDKNTKDYVSATVRADDPEIVEGSIGWLNANERTGGIFVYELGRIVPFDISKTASPETVRALLNSLVEYSMDNRENSRIRRWF